MSSRPRVLFLLHLPPPVHGSAVMGLAVKNSPAARETYDSRFVNLLASKSLYDTGKIGIGKLLDFIPTLFSVAGQAIRHRPKLCYFALSTTGPAFFRDVLLVAILKVFGIKKVYHLHTKGIANAGKKKLYNICYRFVFRKSHVIVLSDLLYSDVSRYVEPRYLHVCPNGAPDNAGTQVKTIVSEEPAQPGAATGAGLVQHATPIRILYLANLIKTKGVYKLLDALAILKNSNVAFEAVFVGGEGNITARELQEAIKVRGLEKVVSYLGKKYNQEKSEIFRSASVFAFPTFYSNESFPLVLLEAMSYSLPVVTSMEGGIPDMVKDGVTGFTVDPHDVDKLASRIRILVEDASLRKKMGAAGRQRYETSFTINNFETTIGSILSKITTAP